MAWLIAGVRLTTSHLISRGLQESSGGLWFLFHLVCKACHSPSCHVVCTLVHVSSSTQARCAVTHGDWQDSNASAAQRPRTSSCSHPRRCWPRSPFNLDCKTCPRAASDTKLPVDCELPGFGLLHMAQLAVPVLVVKPHRPAAGGELLARAQAQFGRVLVGTGHSLWSGMSQAVILSSWSGCALARLSLRGQGELAGGRTVLCRCARRHFFDKKIRKRSGGREGEKRKEL